MQILGLVVKTDQVQFFLKIKFWHFLKDNALGIYYKSVLGQFYHQANDTLPHRICSNYPQNSTLISKLAPRVLSLFGSKHPLHDHRSFFQYTIRRISLRTISFAAVTGIVRVDRVTNVETILSILSKPVAIKLISFHQSQRRLDSCRAFAARSFRNNPITSD